MHIVRYIHQLFIKITKIRTTAGEFGSPVSIKISAVVEQMRSYTLLAFAGVSGVTLKVVVRCDYQKAGLAEEGCIVRTQWTGRFRSLNKDLIRKVFRNTYKNHLRASDIPNLTNLGIAIK